MPTICETATLREADSNAPAGRYRVRVIDAGMGSSGFYPAETLEAAGRAQVISEGTHIFEDHPSETEEYDRPERSVKDLIGVFTSPGTYNPTSKALEGDVQMFGPYRDRLAEIKDAVGLSIRAYARVEEGEIDGKRVPIVTELQSIESVDVVTRAGRGGRVLSVLESARGRVAERAVRHGVTEATAEETRDALEAAIKDAYGADKTWLWVRDFDETTVWFSEETPDGMSLWQQTYTTDAAGAVTLTGARVEVRQVTTYVPLAPAVATTTADEGAASPTHVPPVSPAGSITEESLEDTMQQIEEARLRQLEEAAGRVSVLESERDAAVQRAETAEAALAEANTRATARPVVTGVVADSATIPAALQPAVVEAVLAGLPADADEATIRTAAEAARTVKETEIATIAESLGAGRITGFGGGSASGVTVDDFDQAVAEAFGRQTVKEA